MMGKLMLAAYTYVRDCKKIDYPFVESIQSSLVIADRVFVCDCMSTDGTWEALQSLAACDTRIEIMRHPWGEHYRVQGQICNGILERIEAEGYDFAIQVQADEIVCEWTVEAFRRDLANLPASVKLARPRYTHLCPDYRTRFPFIYERKAVLSRCRTGMRYDPDSDACSIAGGETADVALELMHVGKVQIGREAEALEKELTFQKLYRDLGFPDPKFLAQQATGKVDYRKAFTAAEFTPYTGPWPAAILPRIARAEGRMS